LKEGDYFIKKAGTNLYCTNTGTNKWNVNYFEEKPVFKNEINGSNDQLFQLTLMSNNRYKIVSKSDVPAYLNESAKLRRDVGSFDLNYHTFNILFNGENYAVQTAGNGAYAGYWIINSDLISGSGSMTLDKRTNFNLEFVNKAPTDVKNSTKDIIRVTSIKTGLQIFQNEQSFIEIFSIKGDLINTVSTYGNTIIPLPHGIYLIKVRTSNVQNVKVIVA